MSKIKNGGLDQYGAGPFEQQQFGTAGVEGVNIASPRSVLAYLVKYATIPHSTQTLTVDYTSIINLE